MGKRQRNQRRHYKALHKPQRIIEENYDSWFSNNGEACQVSEFFIHRGIKKISKIEIENFSFERSVIPHHSMYPGIRHFEPGLVSCKGIFSLRNLNYNIVYNLVEKPFDIIMGRNGAVTARIFAASIDKIEGGKAYFSSGHILFEQDEKKEDLIIL